MIAGSLFSGVGGLDLGLARAGFTHAFFAEVDPWRRDVLAEHWLGATIYDDVAAVDQSAWPGRFGAGRGGLDAGHGDGPDHQGRPGVSGPRLDLLAGGFPCQDLSVAGRRAGLDGARSGLFFEFARIIDTLRPSWVLLENVPGLLSSNDGRDMGTVIGTLADLGYGWAYRVLDARYYGVPQRRRRVFIVCRAGGDDASALRALCESCDGDPPTRDCTWQGTTSRPGGRVAGTLGRELGDRGVPSTDAVAGSQVVVSTLQAHGNGRGYRVDAESAAGGHLIPLGGVRRLTPVECERLMSWPDGWTAPEGVKAPDSRRYAACGDGVVSNVSEWIGRRIRAIEEAA